MFSGGGLLCVQPEAPTDWGIVASRLFPGVLAVGNINAHTPRIFTSNDSNDS